MIEDAEQLLKEFKDIYYDREVTETEFLQVDINDFNEQLQQISTSTTSTRILKMSEKLSEVMKSFDQMATADDPLSLFKTINSELEEIKQIGGLTDEELRVKIE